MNLFNRGFIRPTNMFAFPLSDEAYRKYINMDIALFYNRASGVFALGTPSGECINENIGANYPEAAEYLESYINSCWEVEDNA